MPPYTLIDRLLKRELGGNRSKYTSFTGFYGDRKWIADLDIVNELEGHSGCVNALRYAYFADHIYHKTLNLAQLVKVGPSAGLGLG